MTLIRNPLCTVLWQLATGLEPWADDLAGIQAYPDPDVATLDSFQFFWPQAYCHYQHL